MRVRGSLALHCIACAACAACVVALGCKREPPAPVDEGPLPTATASVTATVSASSPAPACVEQPPPPALHLVARGVSRLRVALLDGASVVYDAQAPAFAIATRAELSFDTSMRTGLPVKPGGRGSIMGLGGRWPSAAFLTVQGWPVAGAWENELYRWRGNAWQPVAHEEEPVRTYHEEATLWSERRVLGLHTVSEYRGLLHCGVELEVLDGARPPLMPEVALAPAAPDHAGRCSRIVPLVGGLRALPTGEVFLLGDDGEGSGAGVVERWKPGEETSTVDRLPGAGSVRPVTMLARAPDDVLVGGRIKAPRGWAPYLAHFDGATWSVEEAPGTLPIVGLGASAEGTWLASAMVEPFGTRVDVVSGDGRGELHFRPRGGIWQRAPWPEGTPAGTEPVGIASARGEAWIEATWFSRRGGDARYASFVFRTRAPKKVIDFTPFASPGGARPAPTLKPATAECEKVFVVLYTLAEDAPADYDFPATRAILKGHTELEGVTFVETDDGERRTLGAFADGLAMGTLLADVIRARWVKARPQVLCGEPPRVRRTLPIDLATGELPKAP
jgi:hypothetical protein